MKRFFNYASLLMAAVVLFSCQGTVDPDQIEPNPDPNPEKPTPEKPKPEPEDLELKLTASRNLVQVNVDEVILTVYLGDEVITDDVTFYDGNFKVLNIPNFRYIAPKAGDQVIWASYGTYNSDEILIKAIDIPIPETPEDPQPESTDFKARVLMTEFTTTGCVWCPRMKNVSHNLLADADAADDIVFTTCHSSLVNTVADPSYIKTDYEDFARMKGMPYMICDMYYGFGYYEGLTANDVKSVIEDLMSLKENDIAGIAVNSQLTDDNHMIIKATVKPAKTATYRIGAFLLEDGIYGKQTSATEDWMHIHDDVMRYIDAPFKGYYDSGYSGHLIGEIEKGETADYVFDWDLDVIWSEGALKGEQYGNYYWDEFVMENLHLVVFVSTIGTDDKGNQFYYVNNVIDCPINGLTPYEYK